MHSSPGLGKSAIIKQIAQEFEIGFIDQRLAQMEQADVSGIPYVSKSNNPDGTEMREEMRTSIPDWFPTQEKIDRGIVPEKGILFFDELTNAAIPVQHAAYRIILDREISMGVDLPIGWVLVAAGNKKSDKTGAKGVAPALANRFAMHMDIRPELETFQQYAVSAGFNKEIIGFLGYAPQFLYNFDPSKNDVAFPTPRSWEQASNIIELGLSKDDLSIAISGCVGEGVTHEFINFMTYYSQLPNFTDIMAGNKEALKYKLPSDLGVVFAFTSSLIANIIENIDEVSKLKNLIKMMDQIPDENLVLVFKMISGVDKINKKLLKNFMPHATKQFMRIKDDIMQDNDS